MKEEQLTEREQEYLNCEAPLLPGGTAALRLITGVFASVGQAVFSPSAGYGKADRGLMRTVREIRYTRYKQAVLRKRDGTIKSSDKRLLKKLNKRKFVLAEDTYDPDDFVKKVYEEYLQTHDMR